MHVSCLKVGKSHQAASIMDAGVQSRVHCCGLDHVKDAFLFQSVQTPSRSNNILDLVFKNDCNIIHTCEVGEPLANNNDMVKITLHVQTKIRNNSFLVLL